MTSTRELVTPTKRRAPNFTVFIRLLGPFELWVGRRAASVSPASRRVLAYLALHRGSAGRSSLAGDLWPEVGEAVALARLRTALWRIEQVDHRLVTAGANRIALGPAAVVDVDELEGLARQALETDASLDGRAIDLLSNDAELLPELGDDWVIVARERLRLLRLHALERTAERLAARGRTGLAIDLAARLLASDPLRETAHRLLIESHLALGNRNEALRHFAIYRRRMAEDLQLEPAADIVRLIEPVLRATARDAVP